MGIVLRTRRCAIHWREFRSSCVFPAISQSLRESRMGQRCLACQAGMFSPDSLFEFGSLCAELCECLARRFAVPPARISVRSRSHRLRDYSRGLCAHGEKEFCNVRCYITQELITLVVHACAQSRTEPMRGLWAFQLTDVRRI